MGMERFEQYKIENSFAARTFLHIIRKEETNATIVHHNDADGLCSAAALSMAFDILSCDYSLLPLEKIHEVLIEKIHGVSRGCLIYADLGGQNATLIGKYSRGDWPVLILDHHLPEAGMAENVIHLNPENFGISGDIETSGASLATVFAQELLRHASVTTSNADAKLAIFGIIGAFGDRQVKNGALTGINKILLLEAEKQGLIQKSGGGYILPGFGDRTPEELSEILDLLGSIGYYSGAAQKGVHFLLGKDHGGAIDTASSLLKIRQDKFSTEMKHIKDSGLDESRHIEWVDVKDRFLPMGVKAIGMFLEQLIEKGMTDPDKYVIGFQHLPEAVPGIGTIDIALTKVSARMGAGLREKIAQGACADFMLLIPGATRVVGGIADGCHRFSAASLITRGREQAFIDAFENLMS
jgi:single-stranded-DNA-specific exonuclease